MTTRTHILWGLLAVLAPAVGLGQTSILHSPHNLSASGPGAIRASSEQQVCIFCHAPHSATTVQPLWNREKSTEAYAVYSSNSLSAQPGQPTGSSKLCLSCHDGTIALGSVRSRDQTISMAGGMTTLPAGSSNLGTDLSDDHPISFRYDEALVQKNPRLVSPSALPPAVRLDHRQELQCTSCHNAHDNQYGRFLVVDNSSSQLCKSCHTLSDTSITGHMQCSSCHQPHSAPSGPYLLRGETASQTCLTCHDSAPGGATAVNVASDLNRISRHDTNKPVNLPGHTPDQIGCADCHEPHTMQPYGAAAPNISPRLGRIGGMNASGAMTAQAQFEYEVCFKCHAGQGVTQPRITRQIAQPDKRLQTLASAVSAHPVQTSGSGDVPSLRQGAARMIYCTDCHSSSGGRKGGGTGAGGPHGSDHSPLLAAGYQMESGFSESPSAYALCYSCHDRTSIITNESFPLHGKHIVDERTSCSVCHDPHGIPAGQGNPSNNRRLINFDISVVQPDPVTGRREYIHEGGRSGSCYLSCHGAAHSPKSY